MVPLYLERQLEDGSGVWLQLLCMAFPEHLVGPGVKQDAGLWLDPAELSFCSQADLHSAFPTTILQQWAEIQDEPLAVIKAGLPKSFGTFQPNI